MHEEAEYGIAAHWNYKETGGDKISKHTLKWIDELLKWQKQINVNPSLANTTKIRFYKRPTASISETLSPIYTIVDGEKIQSNVVWADVPEYLKKATIAVEDKDFYKHAGFDPLTPFRIVKNYFTMGQLTGGSTLTQQLVKNVLLTSDKTITRKIKEFILSVQIEAKYKKDEILLMYLNEAPYGGASWGVGFAAEQYFGKVCDLKRCWSGGQHSSVVSSVPWVRMPSISIYIIEIDFAKRKGRK